MKKLLIITHSMDIGGVQKSLISLLNNINYYDYEIDLIVPNMGSLGINLPKQVNVLATPKYFKWLLIPKDNILKAFYYSFGLNFNSFWLLYYIIIGILKRNMGISRQYLFEKVNVNIPVFEKKYDVAIDYSGNYKHIIVEKVVSSKKITWVHSDYRVYKTDKHLDKKYFQEIDNIITVSETAQEILINEFPKLTSKIKIIQNITDKKSIIDLSKTGRPIEYPNNKIIVVDVTRLDPNKGLDKAIYACKKLVEKGININWFIVGDGPEKKKLNQLIKQLKLENNFYLLGEKENPYPYIKNSNVFVHCSLFEGKSVAIDEAKLLSVPIIVTDYPTARDQIEDGYNGMIVDLNSSSIANGIEELLLNEYKYKKIKKNLNNYDMPIEDSLNKFYEIIN